MIPGLLPDQGSGTTPAWEEVTPRHICDESRTPPRGVDRLLIKPTRWARPGVGTREDKSTSRHTEAARSAQSHSQAPPPILAATPTQTDTPTLTDPREGGPARG